MGRPRVVLLSGIILLVGALTAGLTASRSHLTDFTLEWVAANDALGENAYRPLGELADDVGLEALEWVPFPIPRTPGALLMALPLAVIPKSLVPAAGGIFVFSSVLLLGSAVWRLAGPPFGALLAFAVAVLPPGLQAVEHGQSSILTAALLAMFWIGVRQEDSAGAGIPLGLAITLKLFPWLVLVGMAAKRRRAVSSAILTAGLLTAAGLLLPGVSLSGAWRSLTIAGEFAGVPGNLSLLSAADVSVGVGAAAGLAAALATWRLNVDAAIAVLLVVSLVVAPVVWPHYLLVLLVSAAGWLAARSDREAQAEVVGNRSSGPG